MDTFIETVKALGAVAGTVAAGLGVYAAYLGTRTIRAETTPPRSNAGAGRPLGPAPAATSGAASGDQGLSREVEGYIVRFLIFYLVIQLWSAIQRVVVDPLSRAVGSFGIFPFDLIYIGTGLVYALIFFMLGLPLLVDIYRRYGIARRLTFNRD